MTTSDVALAALIVAPVVAWFGAYGLALAASRPRRPDPAPATEDLGTEPPAVVSLLVNHWEITEDAAESTLIDLAARHILEFRQPANDPTQTTVHVRDQSPAALSAYERRVFDRVNGLAKDGVVPLTALTFRDSGQASAWAKRLAAEVVADARSQGLSRRRFGARAVSALGTAALAVAIVEAIAVGIWLRRDHSHDTGHVAIFVGLVTFGVLSTVAGRPHGERDTPAGREVAARWLGVRAWLRAHEAFGDLPPAAVAVWDRYLSYGAAVGATRVSSAVIDLGMGNRKRVWSSFAGPAAPPSWHRVRVHYPRFWPRYGKTAPRIVARAVVATVVGVLLIRYWYGAVGSVFSGVARDSAAASYSALVKGVGLLLGIVLVAYGVYAFVRTVIDLAAPRTVTGEVVWQQLWRSTTRNENTVPLVHYLAIDDASADSTRAWALPHAMSHACHDSDIVTVKVRPWSRRVLEVHVLKPGGESRLGRLFGAVRVPTGPLVTADEVATALGMPVTPRQRSATSGPAPVEVNEFTGPDGSVVLTIVHSSGKIARLALGANDAHSQPIAGIGDEARGGPGWVAARRGDDVLLFRLGTASQLISPESLASLASVAINRLPAGATPTVDSPGR